MVKAQSQQEKNKKAAPAPAAQKPVSAAPVDNRNGLQKRRTMVGTVVSDKMAKTIVVKIDRQVKHGLYEKYQLMSKRYKAHDEKNEAKIGDRVRLVESKPMSREKRWVLQEILRKAGQVAEANV